MTSRRLLTALAAAVAASVCCFSQAEVIDLAGRWAVRLEGAVQQADSISLPGTTDLAGLGLALADTTETTHLSRRHSYAGPATYSRMVTIPEEWRGRPVWLSLERTKPSQVYVDGELAGASTDISTPQDYDLTRWLSPGRHLLEVRVDNSRGVPEQLYASSHAYTEDTQTNWNGIIGTIRLTTEPFEPQRPCSRDSVHPALRDFRIEGLHFTADGHKTFLRGRHDACVWPLTGHVAMDLDSWRRYMAVCQDYGLNHVRFHSWCPPEAAFQAADEAGIVLQPELPYWGSFDAEDSTLMEFLHKEGMNILRRYGHHPSFRLFALGNELWGDIDAMARFVEDFRREAPDKYFTFGSNYYLGYQGAKPGMDFFVTCRNGGEGWGCYSTHTRGSFSFADAADGGMVNHFRPGASLNFEEGCSACPMPVISHETGQFQVYPDYREIEKYTGVLRPCNMEEFRRRLERAGMAPQADAFHQASGQWALRLYKQEIEMDLRTPSMAGFQLLDLQDYPGQGSAYVGVLDAFLDSKGLCTPEEWRQWCAPVVPLLEADRYCFTEADTLRGRILVANYGAESLQGRQLRWAIEGLEGAVDLPGGEGLIDVGALAIPFSELATGAPAKLTLTLSIPSTEWANSYALWVYPADGPLALPEGVTVARELTPELERELEGGASVLLMACDSSALSVGPLFQTDYWNYRMFRTICEKNGREPSPGTLGILADPGHPLLGAFPNDGHSDWQWWAVVKNSRPFILDNAPGGYRPIVQVIDNVERNHRLGLAFEFAVGRGRLLVVAADLDKASLYPEGRQFYASVLGYMASEAFRPAVSLSLDELHRLFALPVDETKIDALDNISPY